MNVSSSLLSVKLYWMNSVEAMNKYIVNDIFIYKFMLCLLRILFIYKENKTVQLHFKKIIWEQAVVLHCSIVVSSLVPYTYVDLFPHYNSSSRISTNALLPEIKASKNPPLGGRGASVI